MTPVTDILARNRDLAVKEAETCEDAEYHSLAQYAYGQANAYAESIRIIEAAAKPEPFKCGYVFCEAGNSYCQEPANYTYTDDEGGQFRRCAKHASELVDLTISEHDDQRDRA